MTRRGAGGQCQHRADYCVGDPIVRYCVGEQSLPPRDSRWVTVDERAPVLTPPTRYRVVGPTSYHGGVTSQLIVMCGAVSGGRETVEMPSAVRLNVTCTGTPPAPATAAGSAN